MRLRPGLLIHPDHRAHEHVPGARQHHHKRPHRHPPTGSRVEPHPEPAVVDLPLVPRRRGVTQHPHLRAASLLRQSRPHPPPKRRHRRLQTVLVAQPLIDRRRRHPRLELLGDVVTVDLDHRPCHLPQPGVDQLREPAPHQLRPLRLATLRTTRRHPSRHGRRHILADRLTVHAQAGRQLMLGPTRIPMDQNLRYVDHVKGSPRHPRLHPDRERRQPACLRGPDPDTTRTCSPGGIA